jgi:hypothetical protein
MTRLLALMLGFIVLTGCERVDMRTLSERNLEGTWRFEEVTYAKFLSFEREHLTEEYNNISWTFDEDGSVLQRNMETGDTWSGTWRVRLFPISDGGGTNGTETLEIDLRNDSTGETKVYDLQTLSVTRQCLRGSFTRDGGTYRYRLGKN